MSKWLTCLLLVVLVGPLTAYLLVTRHQDHPQRSLQFNGDEIDQLRHAAAGGWRHNLAGADKVLSAPTEIVAVKAPKRVAVAQKAHPTPGGSLALNLQRELERVGCYAGELNGEWTTATRQAMSAFLARVNATLPLHQPDAVLLALVQNYPTRVCGVPCPSGQNLDRSGGCKPAALLGQTRKQPMPSTSDTTGWTTTTAAAPAATTSLGDGQMGLAGPKVETKTPRPAQAKLPPTAPPSNWRAELWKRQN